MPGPDGPTTLDALRQIDPDVRCCFMSGHTGRYSEADLLERGHALIDKPFPLEQLVETLQRLVSGESEVDRGPNKESPPANPDDRE